MRAMSESETPFSSLKVKVSATGIGSETPVDSISNASKRPSFASLVTSSIKSSRSVQQMHPFDISTSFSSVCENAASPRRKVSASIFTSLMSLTMTATLRPSRFFRTWLSRVVLPAPRKPERMVTGSLEVMIGGVVSAGAELPKRPVPTSGRRARAVARAFLWAGV